MRRLVIPSPDLLRMGPPGLDLKEMGGLFVKDLKKKKEKKRAHLSRHHAVELFSGCSGWNEIHQRVRVGLCVRLEIGQTVGLLSRQRGRNAQMNLKMLKMLKMFSIHSRINPKKVEKKEKKGNEVYNVGIVLSQSGIKHSPLVLNSVIFCNI